MHFPESISSRFGAEELQAETPTFVCGDFVGSATKSETIVQCVGFASLPIASTTSRATASKRHCAMQSAHAAQRRARRFDLVIADTARLRAEVSLRAMAADVIAAARASHSHTQEEGSGTRRRPRRRHRRSGFAGAASRPLCGAGRTMRPLSARGRRPHRATGFFPALSAGNYSRCFRPLVGLGRGLDLGGI